LARFEVGIYSMWMITKNSLDDISQEAFIVNVELISLSSQFYASGFVGEGLLFIDILNHIISILWLVLVHLEDR
jgi:hypothetical protein